MRCGIIPTDLVLKDKIVVYDIAGQRLGWANYDCKFPFLITLSPSLSLSLSYKLMTAGSSSVNVSTTTSTGKTEFFNAGQVDSSNSADFYAFYKVIPSTVIALLLHIAFFGILPL